MRKIKKAFIYILGSFLAFTLNQTGVSAQYGLENVAYGVYTIPEPTLGAKILSVILSPLIIPIILFLAIIAGIIVFIKRKNKNTKNKS